LGAAIAVDQGLAGRWWRAFLAALFAVLSHGAASLVLYALPLIAWFRTKSLRAALMWVAGSVLVGALWVGVPKLDGARVVAVGGALDAKLPLHLLTAIEDTIRAHLGLEDARAGLGKFLWVLYAALFAFAGYVFFSDVQARARLRRSWVWLV